MKITKIFFSVLLGISALVLGSCTFTEYRPTDGGCDFIIKKVDGKLQWGMVSSYDKHEYIPCQYDSIFSAYAHPYHVEELFIAVKDEKMYAWTYRGKKLLKGRSFSSFTSNEQKPQHSKSVYEGKNELLNEAKTDEGIIFFYLPTDVDWIEFGPAEVVLWGKATILGKKNGKWGIWEKETFQEITPCIYDAIINVWESYFWVKKDSKWLAIDRDGRIIHKSQSLLNKYLKMSSMNDEEYQKKKKSALFRKISIQEASYIAIDPYNSDYISW